MLNLNGSNTNNVSVALTGSNSASIAVLNTNTIGNVTVDASGLTGTTGTVFTYDAGTLGGAASTESITGSGGNDDIDVKNYASTVHAGAGNDTIAGGTKADEIHGEAGNDSLVGGGGNDTIHGGDGNDTIESLVAGTVSITGGAGDDRINIGTSISADDTLDGGLGVNTLQVDKQIVTAYGGATNFSTLRLENNGNTDVAVPWSYSQNVTLFTGTVFDTIQLANGHTQYTVSGLADGTLVEISQSRNAGPAGPGRSGATVLTHATDTATNTLDIGYFAAYGTSIATIGTVTANDTNTINIVDGDAIPDFEMGLNAIQVTQINVEAARNNVISIGAHTSSTSGFGDTARNITVDATQSGGTFYFNAASAIQGQNLTINGISSFANTLIGGAGNDVITGGAVADSLVGGAGVDSITAGAADDNVTGGVGADAINVGTGTDTVRFGGTGETMSQTTAWSTFSSVSTGSVVTADVITGMGNGDIIDLTNAYTVTADVTVSTGVSALAANTAGNYALVSGNYNELTGTFIAGAASTSNNDFIFQYAAGNTLGVVTVVLQDVWTTGSTVTLTGVATTDAFTLGGIA